MRPVSRATGGWTSLRLTAVFAAAALLPLAATMAYHGPELLPSLGLALVLAALWQAVFARLRKRSMDWDGIVSAMLFAMLVPVAVPLWLQGLAFSFGLVFGVLIYGARGRGFLNPVVVALSFLLISGVDFDTIVPGTDVVVWAALGGILLLALGLLSWRLVAGFAMAVVLLSLAWPMSDGLVSIFSAALFIGLVFLIGDPTASPSTNPGRWAHGLGAGALLILFSHSGAGAIGLAPVISAAFLASIFAPLVDQAVVWVNHRQRMRRDDHG